MQTSIQLFSATKKKLFFSLRTTIYYKNYKNFSQDFFKHLLNFFCASLFPIPKLT